MKHERMLGVRRNKRDQSGDRQAAWPASAVRSQWRDLVAEAKTRGEVRVTHHKRTDVVVLSVARYEQLKRRAASSDALATLRAEFDRELEVFNRPGAADRIREAFHATPKEFAAAANAAARRRKRKK